LQKGVSGIKKQNKEKERDTPVPDDGAGEGDRITYGYELGDTIKKEQPVQWVGNLLFPVRGYYKENKARHQKNDFNR
jgi:selenophosphate synthetase-related protein